MLAAAEARLTSMTRPCESYEEMKAAFLTSTESNQGQGLWLVSHPPSSPLPKLLATDFSRHFQWFAACSLSQTCSLSFKLCIAELVCQVFAIERFSRVGASIVLLAFLSPAMCVCVCVLRRCRGSAMQKMRT